MPDEAEVNKITYYKYRGIGTGRRYIPLEERGWYYNSQRYPNLRYQFPRYSDDYPYVHYKFETFLYKVTIKLAKPMPAYVGIWRRKYPVNMYPFILDTAAHASIGTRCLHQEATLDDFSVIDKLHIICFDEQMYPTHRNEYTFSKHGLTLLNPHPFMWNNVAWGEKPNFPFHLYNGDLQKEVEPHRPKNYGKKRKF